jgi:hypothetical protein
MTKTSTRPMVRIHNTETDEIIDREMNDAEFAQYEADQIANAARQEELLQQSAAKSALLARLGITEEEAKLLIQ